MTFKTKFVQDICSTDTETYEELIQLALNQQTFLQNVQNLRKPSIEAMVYALLMKQRGKLPEGLLNGDVFTLKSIVCLINANYLRLQEDNETFRWILSALTLTVLVANEANVVRVELESFLDRFERDLHEIPLFYDVLRTFLVLAEEDSELIPVFRRLDGERMVRRLASESKAIRMKTLACLQTLMNFNAELYEHWLTLVQDPNHMIESRMFLLYQLLETALRCTGDKKADLVRTLQLSNIWLIVIEGITSKDPVCRNEALATIQHVIGYAKQCEEDIVGQFFSWRKEICNNPVNEWQAFVAIVQTLNESHKPLTQPVHDIMDKLYQLHGAWKNVLLHLILDHENSQVVNHGLDYFLQHRKFNAEETKLEKLFLDAFNRAALLAKKMFKRIQQLSKYYGTREAYVFLLETIPTIAWKSVPYYCIASAVNKCTSKLANECKRLQETSTTIQSLTSCINVCHGIENASLKYITFLLLVRCINQLSEPTTEMDILLAVIAEIEKLYTMFAISQELLKNKEGGSFIDHITERTFSQRMERVSLTDTFLIEQVLGEIISKNNFFKGDRFWESLMNRPDICCMILRQYPSLYDGISPHIQDIFLSTKSSIQEAVGAGRRIPPEAFNLREVMITLKQEKGEYRYSHSYSPQLNSLLNYLNKLVKERLESFDYANLTNAIETVQLTHLIAWDNRNAKDNVSKFVYSISLNDLNNSLVRYQEEETSPSIDKVYTMIAEIYHHYCQHEPQWIEAFATEKDWSNLHFLLDVGNIDVLTLAIEILHTDGTQQGPEDWFDNSLRVNMLDRCYESILHYRQSDQYLRLMEKFVKMLYQPYLSCRCRQYFDLDDDEVYISSTVEKYMSTFLKQASTIEGEYQMANIVFECILQLDPVFFYASDTHLEFLVQGMIFGDVPSGNSDLETQVIKNWGLHIPFKQHYQADACILRMQCVMFLFEIYYDEKSQKTLALQSVESMLMECFMRKSPSNNPYHHIKTITPRQRLWIVQALCIVFLITGTKPNNLLEVMLYETSQPCIHHLLELIVADSSIDTLTIARSLKNEKVTQSGIQSICFIIWLRCCRAKKLNDQYIRMMMPWTITENFTTRLCAQIMIKKLLEQFPSTKNGEFKLYYSLISDYHRQTSVAPHVKQFMQDVRFKLDCHCIITVENVFHNIPKAAGLPAEDIVGTALLKECLQKHELDKQFLGKEFKLPVLARELQETTSIDHSVGPVLTDFCAEILPLKSLEQSKDMLLELPHQLNIKKMERTDGLIVIASFVTSITMLGELARSSEQFAIKQLMINSRQDISTKEFQALSRTPEKSLIVGELKAHQ
uniref:Uncharacterized protein n=1 Tax=Anopheles christyi TaxID=43041 RepID=A0A182JRR1_9DIPT